MKLKVYNTDGTDSGKELELNDDIFGIEPNDTLIYEDVRAYLAHQRQGTAKTKGRSEIRGGGRKAFRQKGTGGARRGTIRSPLLKGGGTVFGPKPHAYTIRLTKKMKEIARKSALSYKVKEESIKLLQDFTFEEPKTSKLNEIFNNLEVSGKKVLLLTAGTDMNVYKSGRNIPKVSVLEANKASTYEILHADILLMTESAVEVVNQTLNKKSEEVAA
jgi:large subunit ribosomal protein L4